MRKTHQKIYDALKRGKQIEWAICGFYLDHKRLTSAAEDAILSLDDLSLVKTKGRHLHTTYVVHTTQVEKVCKEMVARGRIVLEVVTPFKLRG